MKLLFSIFIFHFSFSLSAELAPQKILKKMEQNMRGDSSYAEMTMIIERSRYTRSISLRAWALGDDYSMVFVTAPPRDEGTVFLKRKNEIWNYLPRIERTIKLPPSMMSQSWMGSDFSNDDLIRDSSLINDYTHEIIVVESYESRQAWILELTPKEKAAVVWGKVRIWVCKEDFIQLKVKNFDQDGELSQTIRFEEIKKFNDRNLPSRLVLTPHLKDQRTILKYQKLVFGIDKEEDFFSQRNMRRLR